MSGYHTKTETHQVGGKAFHIQSLLDHEQYHDPDGEAARLDICADSWPLFGQVWPSGQVLAQAMSSIVLDGRRILELGAGLALASLVLHQRGGDVTASDYHPLIPVFLAANLRLNGLGALPYRAAAWTDDDAELGEFDLIIGSDLLYESDHPELLADFIDRHASDSAEVIIVDPDRGHAAGFTTEMAQLDFLGQADRADCLLDNGEAYRGAYLRFSRVPA